VVLFEDGFTAKRAVVGMGHPLPPADAPDACGGQAQLDPTDPASIPFLWHKVGVQDGGGAFPLASTCLARG
jgi:hypothetical protein